LHRFLFIIISIVVLLNAQNKITVGTKVAEPFVIKEQNGRWDGISFELWNTISSELNLQYDIKEYDLEGLINAVEKGEIDIAVSPLTITAEREEKMDFTLPYLVTGLSIAVEAKEEEGFFGLAKRVLSFDFLKAVGILVLILFAVGGRIVTLVWMFAAIIIISSITAAIASALTVGQLDTKIKGLNGLYGASVGTIKESSAESFLAEKRINYTYVESVEKGVSQIAKKELDAFVYDAPIMKYLIKKQNLSSKVKVLPITLEPVYYGFAIPANSKLRENLNRQIIKHISDKKWEDVLYRYLGE
jgi:ABC-type amino acid transport substrate-binding protein